MRKTASILITSNQKLVKLDRAGLRRDVRKALELLGVGERELSLLFVDDEGIRTINRDYLRRDRPTNVIAFSLSEGSFGEVNPDILGDVVVSVETAGREAKAAGIPVGDAILNLVIHGILHLTGYDHEGTGGRARVMSAVQEAIFLEIRGYELAVKL
jgi:probable rRNA maturation factor